MKKLLIVFMMLLSSLSFANVKAVTTLTDIYDLVKNIGKDKVDVVYLCRGNQISIFLR